MADTIIPNTDPAVNPEGEVPVTFSEAQQAKINSLLKKEREATERKAAQAAEAEKAALAAKLKELEEKSSKRTPGNKAGDDDPEALKGKLAEIASLLETTKGEVKQWQSEAQKKANEAAQARQEAQNVQKRIAMTQAAQKAKFLNVDHAVMLTEGHVKWDAENNQYIITGEHGQPRLNAAMEPMNLDDFFTDFANKNKYMVRGDIGSGVGTTPSNGGHVNGYGTVTLDQVFGPKSSGKLSMEVKKQDPALWQKLKAQAIAQGIIA